MSLNYPNSPRFDWYFRRERQPKPELAANYFKRLMARCELLYESRQKLIVPLVPTPVHAEVVSAALVWHGFVPHDSHPASARARVVPVFLHGLYPGSPIYSGEDVDRLLAKAWSRNFLLWLPIDPLQGDHS
jgi:hypothetical protein